ncbi:unnamed protein product (macronuclear) [Paramecium tetraurelia]|uniref:EF-hand domain-containing protein n=1 Tax=Paramecium tetraurelia TaxID=5888 RepID=A0CYI0_PARTE|nr:uncharacterized protein GSPATT00011447001 [Paramecium tetraurelia]CAK75847.1 unnamed protein product [Paramecium tetraurelia]|eukprot:XP_001443244.1 hypothetical protein (macronuclear) [Paramecium tetraurelia strain d4-2]
MNQSAPKRSSSFGKSFNFPSETSQKESNTSIYLTETKTKKVDRSINVPLNSWREMSLVELLNEAIELLQENKSNIIDQQKFKRLITQYENFQQTNEKKQILFQRRSKIIKSNIENIISSQNDFQNYLQGVKKL